MHFSIRYDSWSLLMLFRFILPKIIVDTKTNKDNINNKWIQKCIHWTKLNAKCFVDTPFVIRNWSMATCFWTLISFIWNFNLISVASHLSYLCILYIFDSESLFWAFIFVQSKWVAQINNAMQFTNCFTDRRVI